MDESIADEAGALGSCVPREDPGNESCESWLVHGSCRLVKESPSSAWSVATTVMWASGVVGTWPRDSAVVRQVVRKSMMAAKSFSGQACVERS